MAAKKKAVKAGAGAYAAGKAVRSNTYVQRLVEDDELRDNLRNAFESARKAYARMSNGKGPVKAVTENKKVQRDLREAATSLKDAAESLRDGKKKKRRKGRLLLIASSAGALLSPRARAFARRCSTRSSAPRRSSSTRRAPPRSQAARANRWEPPSAVPTRALERAPAGALFVGRPARASPDWLAN